MKSGIPYPPPPGNLASSVIWSLEFVDRGEVRLYGGAIELNKGWFPP